MHINQIVKFQDHSPLDLPPVTPLIIDQSGATLVDQPYNPMYLTHTAANSKMSLSMMLVANGTQ